VPAGIQVLVFGAHLDCLIVPERITGAEREGRECEQDKPMSVHVPPKAMLEEAWGGRNAEGRVHAIDQAVNK
jgi:hypothetical protein